jgi:hypothetical protein
LSSCNGARVKTRRNHGAPRACERSGESRRRAISARPGPGPPDAPPTPQGARRARTRAPISRCTSSLPASASSAATTAPAPQQQTDDDDDDDDDGLASIRRSASSADRGLASGQHSTVGLRREANVPKRARSRSTAPRRARAPQIWSGDPTASALGARGRARGKDPVRRSPHRGLHSHGSCLHLAQLRGANTPRRPLARDLYAPFLAGCLDSSTALTVSPSIGSVDGAGSSLGRERTCDVRARPGYPTLAAESDGGAPSAVSSSAPASTPRAGRHSGAGAVSLITSGPWSPNARHRAAR